MSEYSNLYCNSSNNDSSKLAFLLPLMTVQVLNTRCEHSLIPVKNFHMPTIPKALGVIRNSILYPIFDKTMKKLIPSGIPQFLPKLYLHLLYGNFQESVKKNPKILTLDDLYFGFVLWLISLSISTIVFLWTLFVFLIKLYLKEYFGLILILRFLWTKNFFKHY